MYDNLNFFVQDEFFEQIERIKAAFEDERTQLESRMGLLQGELEEAEQCHQQEENFRKQMDGQNKDIEIKYKRQIEVLKKEITKLSHDKNKVNKENKIILVITISMIINICYTK